MGLEVPSIILLVRQLLGPSTLFEGLENVVKSLSLNRFQRQNDKVWPIPLIHTGQINGNTRKTYGRHSKRYILCPCAALMDLGD